MSDAKETRPSKACEACKGTGKRGRGKCQECITFRSFGYSAGFVPADYIPLTAAVVRT